MDTNKNKANKNPKNNFFSFPDSFSSEKKNVRYSRKRKPYHSPYIINLKDESKNRKKTNRRIPQPHTIEGVFFTRQDIINQFTPEYIPVHQLRRETTYQKNISKGTFIMIKNAKWYKTLVVSFCVILISFFATQTMKY